MSGQLALLLLAPFLITVPGAHAFKSASKSLDSYLGFPARSHLIGCENDGPVQAIAWAQVTRGTPSVWYSVATRKRDGTDHGFSKPLMIANISGDAGMSVMGLTFASKDCGDLLVTFGPTAAANPNSETCVPKPYATYFVQANKPGEMIKIIDLDELPQDVNVEAGTLDYVVDHGPVSFNGNVGHIASASLFQITKKRVSGATKLLSVKQGTIRELAWSPDGRCLAFSNNRGTHGFIGIWNRDDTEITWVAPSVDTDISPVWSSDGSQLAWIRTLGSQNEYDRGLGGQRGPSFEVWVASISSSSSNGVTGRRVVKSARRVFSESKYGLADDGSGYGSRPLLWVNSHTLVVGSEAHSGSGGKPTESDGWLHPVAIDLRQDADGGHVRDLTPGAFEVKHWVLGHHDGMLYVVHNGRVRDVAAKEEEEEEEEGLLETRTVSRIDPSNSSDVLRVIAAGGEHVINGMSNSGSGIVPLKGMIAYFSAGVDRPASVAVRRAATADDDDDNDENSKDNAAFGPEVIISDQSFRLPSFVTPRTLRFPSEDGAYMLSAQLFLPPQDSKSKSNHSDETSADAAAAAAVPGVLFTHGGSQRQMFSAFHFSPAYAALYALNQYLACELGMAILSVNYRSGIGYGHDFRVCKSCMWKGAAEYGDVRAAGALLASLKQVDGSKIGLYGLSYGGLNTMQGLVRDPDLFKAGVANAPVFNWISQARRDGAKYVDVQPQYRRGFHALETGPLSDEASPEWLQRALENQAEAYKSSPASLIQNLKGQLLVIQGDADDEVAFSESIGIVRALRKAGLGRYVQTLVFPDETHGLAKYKSQLQAAEATASFLLETLNAS
eukprot:jgi/Bigna1/83336/fgenesh1_pg.106_\